jgi:sec-independent protein translocase protein TatA
MEVVMSANSDPGDWLVPAVVMVLMFAGNELPGAARPVGTSLRIFKSELHELHTEDKADTPAIPPTPVQVGRLNNPAGQAADQPTPTLDDQARAAAALFRSPGRFRMTACNPGCYL